MQGLGCRLYRGGVEEARITDTLLWYTAPLSPAHDRDTMLLHAAPFPPWL